MCNHKNSPVENRLTPGGSATQLGCQNGSKYCSGSGGRWTTTVMEPRINFTAQPKPEEKHDFQNSLRIWRGTCLKSGQTRNPCANLTAAGPSTAPAAGKLNIRPKIIGGVRQMTTATKKKSAKKIRLQPLGDRVVIKREESEKQTAGGIVLPDSAKDKPARGVVVSVGEGRLLDDGSRSEMQVKVKDRVVFSSYAGETFKVDEQELLLMREDDILAVLVD
jgi:chaperonin GroES